MIAGFSVLEVDSPEEALQWARQWPTMDRDGNTRLELRRFYELEDFEPGPGWNSIGSWVNGWRGNPGRSILIWCLRGSAGRP